VERRHLQGCSPLLCRLRTDGLASTSKYWTYRSHAGDMSLVSIVAHHRQKLGLSLLLHWLAWRETRYGTTNRSTDVLGIVSGALFLGSSGIHLNLLTTRERLLCIDHMRYVWSGTIRGLSMGCVWCVGLVFHCRVYINSNRHDSLIWVPLVCGNHHVDNLMNLMSLSVIDVCCLLSLIACNSCLSRVGCNLLWNDLNRAKTWN
jgi:hypothetical protein